MREESHVPVVVMRMTITATCMLNILPPPPSLDHALILELSPAPDQLALINPS